MKAGRGLAFPHRINPLEGLRGLPRRGEGRARGEKRKTGREEPPARLSVLRTAFSPLEDVLQCSALLRLDGEMVHPPWLGGALAGGRVVLLGEVYGLRRSGGVAQGPALQGPVPLGFIEGASSSRSRRSCSMGSPRSISVTPGWPSRST